MKLPIFLLSLLFCTAVVAKDSTLKRKLADNYYSNFDFHKAIPMYEQLLKDHPKDYSLNERLATIYDHLNDSRSAEKYYEFLVGNAGAKPSVVLKYANVLSRNGKYELAKKQFANYHPENQTDTRGAMFENAYQNLNAFYKDSASFKIKMMPFSSEADDFSPAYFGDAIVFSSDRSGFSMVRSMYNWTQSPYLDLYIADPGSSKARPFAKELNTPYHEGPVCFDASLDTVIFTRSSYYNSTLFKSNDGITKLGLFQANWNPREKKWVNVKPLSLNNVEYSVEHPALSSDGQALYFASDMPGGFGGMDLYVSHQIRDLDGGRSWGAPVNLGSAINSPGNDLFPFIDRQGNLWYASDGIPGLGGLDIFCAPKSADGFSEVINPGYPMNTRFDDFGYITKDDGQNGYLSSDRRNEHGKDDIYSVSRSLLKKEVVKPKAPALKLQGFVFGAADKDPIPACAVVILNEKTSIGIKVRTDMQGQFVQELQPESEYVVSAANTTIKGKCNEAKARISTVGLQMDSTLIVSIPVYCEGDVISVADIYYDLNKFDIRPDAEKILDKLLKVMSDYPNMVIELRSHTDSRGSSAANQILSDNRAKAAADYLYSKGIQRSRILSKGYGESMLLNKCADGVPCPEEEHQKNRRTEFKVLRVE